MSSLVRRLPVGRALAALVFLACGGDQTRPGGGSDPSIPVVTAVQPGVFLATNLPQSVTIRGSGFDAPTVVLTSPAGDTTQLTEPQLASVSATSISAQMTVGVAGGWRVLVRNGDGKASLPFSFAVGPAAPPTVQSISPATLITTFAFVPQTVTIAGSGFQRGSSVLLTNAGVAQTAGVRSGPDSLSPTSLSFPFIAVNRFDFDIFVVNPDGQMSASSVHLAGRLPVPDPTVTSITPATIGMAAVKQIIAFTGTGFEPGMTVFLYSPSGGQQSFSGTAVQTPSPGTVRVFALLNATGDWTYNLENPDQTLASGTIVVGPPLPNQTLPPAITGIVPANLVAADTEQLITLQGSSFQPGLVPTFVAQSAGFTDSGHVVSVAANAAQVKVLLGQPGTWMIGVQNPDGAPSNNFKVTVAAAAALPPAPISIVSAQPSSVLTSLTSQSVVLNGTGFSMNSVVRVTPPPADLDVTFGDFFPDHLSRTQLRLNGVFDRAGIWHVEIDSLSTHSNVFDIAVSPPGGPAPAVTALDPPPFLFSPNQLLHIRGSKIQPGLRILVVGDDSSRTYSPIYFSVDSVTPASARVSGSWPRSGRVQIQNPDGHASNILRYASNPLPFSCSSPGAFYRSDAPIRLSLGCVSVSPSVSVTLTDPSGAGRPVSNVSLGTVTSSFGFVSFTATLDTGGAWNPVVTNSDGQKSAAPFFVYTFPAPTITGVPSSVTASHTPQPITIQGTGFQNGLTVKLALSGTIGISLGSIGFAGSQIGNLTPTSLQVSPPLWVAGSWTVVVTNPDGQTVTSRTFNVTGLASPPSVSSVSPSTLAASTPRLVTVSGQSFEYPLDVIVTSPSGVNTTLSRASLVNRTSSQFQFYMGFDQPGTWKLVVRNLDNQLSNSVSFTVQ